MYGCYGLKKGDRIKVTNEKGSKKVTVVKEYPFFILVDTGKYQTSINKSSVYTKEVLLAKL